MAIFELPPAPKGTPEEQINQLYRYLFRLVEQLNVAESGKKGETE